jgi:protein SCO1/2
MIAALVAIASLACAHALGADMRTTSASRLGRIGWEQKLGARLPFEGAAPLILTFNYFRCPNLCNLTLNGLADALQKLPDRLGQDYRVLTLSIDPAESPRLALMKQRTYLARLGQSGHGADWRFETRGAEEIRALTRAAGFKFARDPATGELEHPSGFVVLTPRGVISKYFFGIRFDARALHAALAEARAGRQGTIAERILLYCFHYDPSASAHGPLILSAVRVAAITGCLALVALLLALARPRPRPSPRSRSHPSQDAGHRSANGTQGVA